MVADERWLSVKGVHLRDAARGEDEDHPVGLRREMGRARSERIALCGLRLSEKSGEREGAEAAGCAT